MEHPSFPKQPDADTRSFPFRHLRTQLAEQRFNIAPFHLCAGGMRKDQFKGFSVLARHGWMVPNYGVIVKGEILLLA
jgi:hypothetical protein